MDVEATITHFSDVPSRLAIDILLRLPIQTLLMCRQVCKDWLLLFSDPSFINRHLASSPANFLYRSLRKGGKIRFGRLLYDDDGILGLETVEFPWNLNFPYEEYKCINSCNGILLCLQHSSSTSASFRVCNPILGEVVNIPCLARICFPGAGFALGFSAKANQYKVLFSCRTRTNYYDYGFEIYTLDGTRKWRSVIDETLSCRIWDSVRPFLHRSLLWLNEEMICAFDFETEKFTRFSMSSLYKQNEGARLGLIYGCLCAAFCDELWVMKEYGVEKSWTVMLSCSDFIPGSPSEASTSWIYKEVIIYEGCCVYDFLFSFAQEEILIIGKSLSAVSFFNTNRMKQGVGSYPDEVTA